MNATVNTPLLELNDVKKYYPVKRNLLGRATEYVHAVDGVSLQVFKGETLSLVGESGCGKSTIGRAILRLTDITAGQVILKGKRIDDMSSTLFWPLRREMQMVFQDPFSSLDPRMTVFDILAEPIRNFGLAASAEDLGAQVHKLLVQVGLRPEASGRRPHEFSGGQRQRIGIARALATRPELIVCDEAVSALDVSVKSQIVNLLCDLQRELGLSLLFISHDLAIVEYVTHRVAVMYLGKIVELGEKRDIFGSPRHPYTQALLSAVPVPDPDAPRKRIVLQGDIPSPINPPTGCRFHTRCPQAADICRQVEPAFAPARDGHWVACHFARELPATITSIPSEPLHETA